MSGSPPPDVRRSPGTPRGNDGGLGPDRTPPEQYWEDRLGRNFSLQGVGYHGLGGPFNQWAYRVRRSAVRQALRIHGIPIDASDVLEVGFGTGYFVEFWTARRARTVTGLDLTQRAVLEVSARFPQHRFHRQDISAPDCPVLGSFDLVTAFDVLFHILDDGHFERAVGNICRQVRPGGHLFLTDILSTSETIAGLTQRSRPLPIYRRLLESYGLRVAGLQPVFFCMSRSPDLSRPWARRLSTIYWSLICALMEKAPWAGHLVGPAGCATDLALQRLVSSGPSVKLLIARRDP